MVNAIRGVNEVLWSLVKKEECGFYPWEQCELLWGSAEFQPCKNQLRYFLCGAKIQVPILCQGPGYPGPAPAGVFVLAKLFLSARCHILFLPPPQAMFQSKSPFPPVQAVLAPVAEMLRGTFDVSKAVSSQASPARSPSLSGSVCHAAVGVCSSTSSCERAPVFPVLVWALPACFVPLNFLQCSIGLDCKKGI